VHRARDLGGLVFFDLRDRAGLVQVSIDLASASPELAQAARALGAETVVLVEGTVTKRPEAMRNAELGTGGVDVSSLIHACAGFASVFRKLAPSPGPG